VPLYDEKVTVTLIMWLSLTVGSLIAAFILCSVNAAGHAVCEM